MSNHIKGAIAELEQRQAALTEEIEKTSGLIQSLRDLLPPEDAKSGKRESGKAKTRQPARAPRAPREGSISMRDPGLIAEVRKMPEPITVAMLVATGRFGKTKDASNYIVRAKSVGWLEKTGRGEYRRTRSFGEESAAA